MPDLKINKHILGTSELSCVLPLKEGFVEHITDTRTYATRLVTAVKVLDGLRVSAREVQRVATLTDSVDAIASIHSFSFCPLPGAVLLSATFDKPWEPYIRIIWRELGPVLDLALCNCKEYDAPALEQGFERFVAWIRKWQVKSEFFYAPGNLTLEDQRYLKTAERLMREGGAGADAALASLTLTGRKAEARRAAQLHPQDAVRQHGAVLSTMFALCELYKGADARFLAGATRVLLPEIQGPVRQALAAAMPEKLHWFDSLPTEQPVSATSARPLPATSEFQGGIIKPYGGTKHGCLLLLRIVDPEGARNFLRNLPITSEDKRTERSADPPPAINIAFTLGGLDQLGVSKDELSGFPSEFREGMEARAGLLGDVRDNHPENWVLPLWNGPNAPAKGASRVALSSVDIVITVRARDQHITGSVHEWSPSHPLFGTVQDIANGTGIELLSVEPMLHYRDEHALTDGSKLVREHFGFADGLSQPEVEGFDNDKTQRKTGAVQRDVVKLGDLLIGHPNSHGDPPFPTTLERPDPRFLLDNGSFLVVRKLRQHVDRLDDVLFSNRLVDTPQALLAKCVGRTLDGKPLVSNAAQTGPNSQPTNDFTYDADTTGAECPFQSHVRRGNPRTTSESGAPVPRIARRGMSYGPKVDRTVEGDTRRDRGTIFMAYCASIGEQFEVIQGWMTGGNSTGTFSGHADPLLRVPEPGDNSPMRLRVGQTTAAIRLGDKPLVTLQWGLYLFVPSIAALKALANPPRAVTSEALPQRALTPEMRATPQWQGALEDLGASQKGTTAGVLAEIRNGGGIHRSGTQYGVVVTDPTLAQVVLTDDKRFSVSEYGARMKASVGLTYLGLDNLTGHKTQSLQPNAVVKGVTRKEAFNLASTTVTAMLNQIVSAQGSPAMVRLDEVLDRALAAMSKFWFGVPDGVFIKAGGVSDEPDDVRLPSHSIAPSRYIFSSPAPLSGAEKRGQEFGAALENKVLAYVQSQRDSLPGLSLDLSKVASSDEELALTIVGMLEGFLPPVWGNVYRTLHQWLTEDTLWRVQQDVLKATDGAEVTFAVANSVIEPALRRAMQQLPVPEMIYRTATRDTTLGDVGIKAGERIVISVRGATTTQPEPETDHFDLIFGGAHRAGGPVHACPAREMGMGVMLGILAAILGRTPIHKTPSRLVVRLG